MLNYKLRIELDTGEHFEFEDYARDESHAWWKALEWYSFGKDGEEPAVEMSTGLRTALLHKIVKNLGPGCFTWTAAPNRYNGFGTTPVGVTGMKNQRGEDIRKVWTPLPHVLWQRERYHSGLCGAWDEKQWTEERDYLAAREMAERV